MRVRNPMTPCGAKTRGGARCKQPALANGRCHYHGGKSTGPPMIHGRRSEYIRLFGERYARCASDPDLLRSEAELALFDTFLHERAELLGDGFSAAWLDEVRETLGGLRAALFVTHDTKAVQALFPRLESQLAQGGERVAAWEELLEKARTRSEIASKAAGALAKQDQVVTESRLLSFFAQMLRILVDVAGTDTAGRVKDRFEREVLGRVGPGVGGAAGMGVN